MWLCCPLIAYAAYVESLAGWNKNHDKKPSSTGLFSLAASVALRPNYSPVTVAFGTCLVGMDGTMHINECRKCNTKERELWI